MRIAFALAFALSACAPAPSRPAPQNASATNQDGLICREETPTGTNLPRKVCRTPEQIEDERREAQDFLRLPERRRN